MSYPQVYSSGYFLFISSKQHGIANVMDPVGALWRGKAVKFLPD